MTKKIASIVWATDPDGNPRFLLRHNKPFNGYEDEWTICFGDIEDGEDLEQAAIRETKEEYGIQNIDHAQDLNYTVEFSGKNDLTTIYFFAIKIESLDTAIVLNEESIGYDWVTLEHAQELMQHEDEFHALTLVG